MQRADKLILPLLRQRRERVNDRRKPLAIESSRQPHQTLFRAANFQLGNDQGDTQR
jgi:hypothetical protein